MGSNGLEEHFKLSHELQELKRELRQNIAKSKIGYDVPKKKIDSLRDAISAIEKRLFLQG